MGCLHSKKESTDLHPNVFRVVNIDENGVELCSGQLEITDSDIILYREGRDSTLWPLHSLRRYGFEGEIFSFESGRRCETGEGIYAFRCRRAALLFHTLQQQIQLRNAIHDSVPYPVARLTPSPQGRQTLQASVIHRSSIDNGQTDTVRPVSNNNLSNITPHAGVPRLVTQSPRSPSSADILEVMPLYPRAQANGNHVTNVYQLRDFKREHNNNQSEAVLDPRHVYSNDINRDLAILRNTLRQETVLNTMRDIEDETRFLESRYMNKNIQNKEVNNPLSPTLSNNSEHYAQLSMEQQEAARLYVNIGLNESNVSESEVAPSTPLTPKQVEYCNLAVGYKPEIVNTYANITLGEIGDTVKNVKQILNLNVKSEHNQKYSESDTFTSLSPVEELEVNYAVLDIDSNKEFFKGTRDLISPENQSYNSSRNESTASCTSQPHGRLISQSSIEKPSSATLAVTAPSAIIGYTTIDFDKTVALTSVAAGTDVDLDGPRKTRHNSCNIMCGSPSSVQDVLNSAKIEKLIVPPIVQNGSTNVLLDCQYSVPDGQFTVQWWFNEGDTPVFQWTPPQVTGILEGQLDLSFKVSLLPTEQYRAMRIIRVEPQLSGEYTCVVNNNGIKAKKTKSMQVLAPEKEFELLFEHKFNRLVEVTCYAHSVHPQPDLTVEYYDNEPISQQTQRVWRRDNLLYDVESTAQFVVPECSDRLDVICRLNLPQADYTAIKKRLLHLGPVQCSRGWKHNYSAKLITLSLIIFVSLMN